MAYQAATIVVIPNWAIFIGFTMWTLTMIFSFIGWWLERNP